MWHTEFCNPKEFCKNLRKYLIRVFYCILPVTPEFEFDMGRKASSQQPWHVTKAATRAISACACITCLNVANTFPVQCSRAMKSAPSQSTETSWEARVQPDSRRKWRTLTVRATWRAAVDRMFHKHTWEKHADTRRETGQSWRADICIWGHCTRVRAEQQAQLHCGCSGFYCHMFLLTI